MLVERAKCIILAAPGVVLPDGDGGTNAKLQDDLKRALEEALAKCDAIAAASVAHSTPGAQPGSSSTGVGDNSMQDVPPRRKRDAVEPTELLEDAAASDEELQRIKRLNDERRLPFEGDAANASGDPFSFKTYLADDDQHL